MKGSKITLAKIENTKRDRQVSDQNIFTTQEGKDEEKGRHQHSQRVPRL